MMNHLKKITAACFMMFLAACGGHSNNQAVSDSTYTSTTLNDTTADSQSPMATVASGSVAPDSRMFIMNAKANGNLQIEAAKRAMQQSANEAVKNLAKTISDQNTELANKLDDVIKSVRIQLTDERTPEMKDDFEKVYKKTGADFDRSYLKLVIAGYEKNIAMYKQAASAVQEQQLKQYASTAIPILQQHLDAARAIK